MGAVGATHKLRKSWAAERQRDNLIDGQRECVGGETEKLKRYEENEWRTDQE